MARSLIPLCVVAAVAISLFAGHLHAGDDGAATTTRREFRQSNVYPYTFQPVSYLETGGPKQMRFALLQGECSHREAPALPTPTPAPEKTAAPEPAEQKEPAPDASPAPANPNPTPVPPAFPPPANAPAAGGPDLTKMPDEVMNVFKNPYNAGPRGPHLFDPIFEPGYNEGPKSKATYEVSDKP